MTKNRSGGNRASRVLPRQPVPVPFDYALIQQIEEMTSGETVHRSANLTGAYCTAWSAYEETGDPEFLSLAEEAERQLRILLYELRRQRVGSVCWM